MSKIFSFSIYFTSFLPLWLSILFINLKSIIEKNPNLKTEYISIFLIPIIFILAIVVLILEFFGNTKENTATVTIKNIKVNKTLTAEYLLSYILPLFTFDFTKWDNMVLFLIFFFTLGYLNIKHNHFSINILLELAKFQFYNCEIETEDKIPKKFTIISNRNLTMSIGQTINIKSLNNEYKLDIH